MDKPRVMLFETDPKAAAEAGQALWSRFVVDSSSTPAGAKLRLRDFAPDLLVARAGAEGEELCRHVKRVARGCAVLLVFPSLEGADARAEAAGADGFLSLPLNAGALVSCAAMALREAELSRKLERLRVQVDDRTLAPSGRGGRGREAELEFFKRAMSMEVRRSRRYRWPLAILAAGIDRFEALVRLRVHERTHLVARYFEVVERTIRDIDLAVQEGEERFLVALPQTDLEGASYVAERLRERMPLIGEGPAVTVSVGVGAYDGAGEDEATFRDLLSQSTGNLQRAQSLGGNRVESIPGPKTAR